MAASSVTISTLRREGNGCRPDYLLTATSVTLVPSVAKQISRPLPSDPHNITADQWINRHVSLLQGLFWDWEWASEEHSSPLPSYWSESLCLDGERKHLIHELCGQHVSAAALGLVHVLKPRVCTTIDHCNLYWSAEKRTIGRCTARPRVPGCTLIKHA